MATIKNLAGYEFVDSGELLAVDLINTEIVVRRKRHDLLQTPEDARDWFNTIYPLRIDEARVNLSGMSVPDPTFLVQLKLFRGKLHALIDALVAGNAHRIQPNNIQVNSIRPNIEQIHFLNVQLAAGQVGLSAFTEGVGFQVMYQAPALPGAPIMLACALSAMHLLVDHDLTRLHKCHNPQCVLYFYDKTRSATRKWCSTECMDRERSAERYRQLKASDMT